MNAMLAMLAEADAAVGDAPPVSRATIILRVISSAIIAGFTIYLFIQAFRRSESRLLLLIKWVLSLLLGALMVWKVAPLVGVGGYTGMGAILLVLVCGWGFAFIWRTSLASMIAQPFANLYDGGNQQLEPKPFYSIAFSKRKRGHYTEAIRLIREQLEKFPDDFEGQFLVAEIQAENLNDLPGAEITIERLVAQPQHPQKSIAFALNSLADWEMKYGQDRNAARAALEKIIERFPDSELSAVTAQRIAHLADTDHLLSTFERKKYAVAEGPTNLGLLMADRRPQAPVVDLVKQAQELAEHLASHPLDTEAREKLALLYANHYGRLDLATEQLEQLVSHPNQPAKRVVHWLNVLADLQVRHCGDYDIVRATLQKIVDAYPDSPAAEIATSRIAHLKLELNATKQGRVVKLGTYEQDIGLKEKRGKV